jgi:hypothetical protein
MYDLEMLYQSAFQIVFWDSSMSARLCRTGQGMEDYRPMVSSKCPKSYVQLMTMCLDRTAEKRPDFLGGNVNIVVELERLIHEEYQKMASGAAAAAAAAR